MQRQRPLAYVISPQPWAGFHVSKHHYAIALAQRGWRVVFVDPPADLGGFGRIEISQTEVPGVSNLRYQTIFPYKLKFHARMMFDFLMRNQARRIVARASQPSLVWDFDNAYQFRDLSAFGAPIAMFHLVDDVGQYGLGSKNADFFFYLHDSFCRHAGSMSKAEYWVEHGLGRAHELAAQRDIDIQPPTTADRARHVGFVGNLAAPWIDWEAIVKMVRRHNDTRFTFWGPLPEENHLDSTLSKLQCQPNLSFPGLTSPEDITEAGKDVDVWLIPFRNDRLLGGALNSHKVLEYLSTGKAVVMNWLEAYENNSLVYMLPESDSTGLADLLDSVLCDLPRANAPDVVARRRSFALERSYDRRLQQIFAAAGMSAKLSPERSSDAA